MNRLAVISGAVLAPVAAVAMLLCSAALASSADAVYGSERGDRTAMPARQDSAAAARVDSCRNQVHVYYFHPTIRCQTCLTFEAYAWEAISSRFADELVNGRLAWSVLNMEDESNASLASEHGVFESALVVSVVHGGVERSWKRLEDIWWLVQDKSRFLDYVTAQVDSALARCDAEGRGDAASAVPVHGELVPKSDG
jgi:hypothetical protein